MIDRLPVHASFAENSDGSRTLYWPTSEADLGEHRFRITALNPDDETRASSADVLIVVGGSTGEYPGPVLQFESASDVHDPYSTYDDNPPYDPYDQIVEVAVDRLVCLRSRQHDPDGSTTTHE